MPSSRQSLPLRQSQARPGSPRSRGGHGAWLALTAALALSACGKPEATPPATEPAAKPAASVTPALALSACGKTPAPAAKPAVDEAAKPAVTATPALSERQLEAEIGRALTPSRSERDAELVDRAEAVLDQYPGKNVTELLNTPEVNASLKVALTKLAENKPLQNQINTTVALAAQMQGLSGAPGSSRLDLDTSKYDHARKSRLLQAVLSEDPRRIVGFLAQEIGEAVPELSFEGVERASNGIAIKENPPPAK